MCRRCILDRVTEFDISYMLWELYCGYPHLHANWHYLVILHLFHLLSHVYLLLLQCLFLYLYVVHCLKCCMIKFSNIECIYFYIFIDIIKFSSCIFIVLYVFLDVSVIISDILGVYYSIQTVIL